MGRIKRLLLQRRKAERKKRIENRRQKRREFRKKTKKFVVNKSIALKKLVFQKEFLLGSWIFINSYFISQEFTKMNTKLHQQQVEITRLKIQLKLQEKMEKSWYSNINWPAVLFLGSKIYTNYTKLSRQNEPIVEEPIVEEPQEETEKKLLLPYLSLISSNDSERFH